MMENTGNSSGTESRYSFGSQFSNGPNVKLTWIDSGIETGNDSNDSAIMQNMNLEKITATSDENILDKSLIEDTNTSPSCQLQEIRAVEKWPIDQPGPSLSLNEWDAECEIPELSCGDIRKQSNCGIPEELLRMCRPLSAFPLQYHALPSGNVNAVSKIKRKRLSRRLIKNVLNHMNEQSYERLRSLFLTKEEHKLCHAVTTNNIELVKSLMENGVSPNCSDCEGRTPLHLASGRGYVEIVNMLLWFGANAEPRDCVGNTPLHLAAATNKIFVVRSLLDAGTDPLSIDCHGYSPLQIAQTKLRMLQNAGGDDMLRVKTKFQMIVNMLLAYVKNRRGYDEQVEALSNVCSRLSVSNTDDQVQDEFRGLLSSIDSLNLKK